MDGSHEEEGLVVDEAMHKIFETKELDYLTHIVLRMFENKAVRKDQSTVVFALPFSSNKMLFPFALRL